ncbi:MAG: AEC family transporter [Tepidisphaerales bacterium]
MTETWVVAENIIAMFLVLLVGYVARRRNIIDTAVGRVLAAFTTDVALPALIFTQMLSVVNRAALAAAWPATAVSCAVLTLGGVVGWAGWRMFCDRSKAPTFIFVVAIGNWIYLPLPIVQALYHDAGVRILFLSNAGAQVVLWTGALAVLKGGRIGREAIIGLATNSGLIATAVGIIAALLLPQPLMHGWPIWATVGGNAVLKAMKMVGDLTVPLSLVVIGVQLGSLSFAAVRPGRAVIGVGILRLIVTPAVVGVLMWLSLRLGLPLHHDMVMVMFLVGTMPVAISCSVMADRFAHEGPFAAQCIFYTTLASIVTVPVAFWAFKAVM